MKVLLLFRIVARESDESQECTYLQSADVTRSRNTVEIILGCFGLRSTTDGKMDHSLRFGIIVLE